MTKTSHRSADWWEVVYYYSIGAKPPSLGGIRSQKHRKEKSLPHRHTNSSNLCQMTVSKSLPELDWTVLGQKSAFTNKCYTNQTY